MTHIHLNLVRIKSKREGQAGATGQVMQAACYTDPVQGLDWYYVKWDHLEGRYSYHQLEELEALEEGSDLAEKLQAGLRQIRTSLPTLVELEAAGLVPSSRVDYSSPEWDLRWKLGLPVGPPSHRTGEWAWNDLAGHNARLVRVDWDRAHREWRFSFYGYGPRWVCGPILDGLFVQYQEVSPSCGAPVYPALNAALAGVLNGPGH